MFLTQAAEEYEIEVEQKNKDFLAKQDNFYNVQVANITTRHAKEVSEMEELLSLQLKASTTLQEELKKLRSEIIAKDKLKGELSEALQSIYLPN